MSKSFSSSNGAAFLFRTVCNTFQGPPARRDLLTGPHVISSLMCKGCTTTLGWIYIKAFEPSQHYKEGKSILESAHIYKVRLRR